MGRFVFKYFGILIEICSFFIKIFPLRLRLILYSIFSNFPTKLGILIRYIILKSICNRVGVNVSISRLVVLKNIENITFGDNVSIHQFSYLDGLGGITIGDNVSIAHNSSIISFEHTYDDVNTPIKYNKLICKSISISDDVWVGCGVRILAGASVGNRVIIAAGSLVKGHLNNNSIYAGVPSTFKKTIK